MTGFMRKRKDFIGRLNYFFIVSMFQAMGDTINNDQKMYSVYPKHITRSSKNGNSRQIPDETKKANHWKSVQRLGTGD